MHANVVLHGQSTLRGAMYRSISHTYGNTASLVVLTGVTLLGTTTTDVHLDQVRTGGIAIPSHFSNTLPQLFVE